MCAAITVISSPPACFDSVGTSFFVTLRSVSVCLIIGVEIRSLFLPITGLELAGDFKLKTGGKREKNYMNSQNHRSSIV